MCQLTPEVLQRLIDGDELAWAELWDCWNSRLFNYATRLLSREDGEDAVQETWIYVRFNLSAGNMDQERLSIYFLLGHIYNYAVNIWRRNKRQLTSTSIDSSRSDDGFAIRDTLADHREETDPAIHLLRSFDREKVRKCIDKLPPQDAEVIRLRVLYELKNNKVAQLLELSAPGATNRYTRAMARLRDLLLQDEDFGPDYDPSPKSL